MAGYLFTMLESVFTTISLTKNKTDFSPWAYQCYFYIFICVFTYSGIMAVYFTRMWRVYKVFGLYQAYLDQQRLEIEQEQDNSPLDLTQMSAFKEGEDDQI